MIATNATQANPAESPAVSTPFVPCLPMDIFDAIFGRCRPDSLIALGSRRADKTGSEAFPHFLCPVTVADRAEMLPIVFQHQVEHSQYLMPNTLAQTATKWPIQQHVESIRQGGQILYFAAKNKHVRELVAITIDLDVGRGPDDLTAGQALGASLDMSLRGELPLPSLCAFSGRGAYLMWLLRDVTDSRPPLNTRDNLATWQSCSAALWQRTRHLKADPNAKRLANWYKRPGTIDTKTGNLVVYMTFGAHDLGRIPTYTLPGLAATLEVHHEPLDTETPDPKAPIVRIGCPCPQPQPSLTPKKRSRVVKAGKGSEPSRVRIEEIERLNAYRGGFREGCRHMALVYYSQAVYRYWRVCGESVPEPKRKALSAAVRLNRAFNPPLAPMEVEKAAESRLFLRSRNATIARDLGVTEAEVSAVGLRSLLPLHIAQQRKAAETTAKAEARAKREAKAAAVDAALVEHPELSDTEVARSLADWKLSREFVRSRRLRLAKIGQPIAQPTLFTNNGPGKQRTAA